MAKRFLILLSAVVLTLGFLLMGCPTEEESANNATGTATGSAQGYGDRVYVTITLENGVITNAIISGPKETVGYGDTFIQNAGALIVEKNSVDAGVDAVVSATPSGGRATVTPIAIKRAGAEAIAKIKRGEFDS
jgi:fumarate reductase flavoprotein subunit